MAKKKRKKSKIKAGNFRRATPQKAKAYLASWEKKKDASDNAIVTAVQINLDDPKKQKLARIRFNDAYHVMLDYHRRLDAYETGKVEHKAQLAAWKKIDPEVKGPKPKYPAKPGFKSKATNAKRAGNFRPMTQTQAKNYLKRLWRHTKQDVAKIASAGNLGGATANRAGHKLKFYTPRIKEAVTLLGVEEAAKIKANALILRDVAAKEKVESDAKKAKAAAKRKSNKADKIEAEIKKIEARKDKYLEKIQDHLNNLREQLSSLRTMAAAARRRRAKRRKSRKSRHARAFMKRFKRKRSRRKTRRKGRKKGRRKAKRSMKRKSRKRSMKRKSRKRKSRR